MDQVVKGWLTYPRVAAGAGLEGIVLLSVAALSGWNPVSESRDSRLQTGLRVIGYRAYADVVAADVSARLAGWTSGDTTRLRGADLEGLNLRHVRASWAFLVSANLRGADLHGAVLSSSNMEGSDLSHASLKGASLADIRLRGATLLGATLDSSEVRGADLQSVNLEGASLLGIRAWNDIRRVTGANLYGVRNPPDGFLEWAVVNGAMCVEGAATWSAVLRGEMEIPAPPSDVDVNSYCGVPGEQQAVAVPAVEIIPVADTVTDLGAIAPVEAAARDSANN